tara:strand:- start:983 stop:1189 length:207 start_codon:yes stop_codon:yes gene_type:complete
MYKYRSKCRWNMLLHIDGEVIEIRPGELFESQTLVSSRNLEIISKPLKKKKIGRPPKITTQEDIYGKD